jgi:hypothetical protein
VTFQGEVLRGVARCRDTFFPEPGCFDLDEFARRLTFEEEADLRDAVRTVAVHERSPNGCDTIAIDPCLVNAFRWDAFRVTDFECRAPKLPASEVNRLVRLLDDLANRS